MVHIVLPFMTDRCFSKLMSSGVIPSKSFEIYKKNFGKTNEDDGYLTLSLFDKKDYI